MSYSPSVRSFVIAPVARKVPWIIGENAVLACAKMADLVVDVREYFREHGPEQGKVGCERLAQQAVAIFDCRSGFFAPRGNG